MNYHHLFSLNKAKFFVPTHFHEGFLKVLFLTNSKGKSFLLLNYTIPRLIYFWFMFIHWSEIFKQLLLVLLVWPWQFSLDILAFYISKCNQYLLNSNSIFWSCWNFKLKRDFWNPLQSWLSYNEILIFKLWNSLLFWDLTTHYSNHTFSLILLFFQKASKFSSLWNYSIVNPSLFVTKLLLFSRYLTTMLSLSIDFRLEIPKASGSREDMIMQWPLKVVILMLCFCVPFLTPSIIYLLSLFHSFTFWDDGPLICQKFLDAVLHSIIPFNPIFSPVLESSSSTKLSYFEMSFWVGIQRARTNLMMPNFTRVSTEF